MAASGMTLEVVVRLRDELSRGLDGALNRIRVWGQGVTVIIGRIGRGILDLGSKFGALGFGTGAGLSGGLDSFIKYDAKLRDIAITYGKVGDAVEQFIKKTGTATEKLAKDTGQISQQLLEARGILAAANVDEGGAEVMIRPIGRAATASGANIGDITKTAVAAFQNAELKPELLETALSHMITGGKLGSFELKDMSQHFPEVLAALGNLGVKGMEAIDSATAMLQISKRTAGTPGEAATNMKDFLSGLNSAHTVKRFNDKGVDLSAVIADANARGINPVEAVIQKIARIIDQPKVVDEAMTRAAKSGLDPTKTQEEVRKAVEQAVAASGLGELFVNQQSKMFLMSMLANTSDYLDMKRQIAGADGAVIDQDFASRMAGPEAKMRMAQESVEQVMRRLGSSLSVLIGGVDSVATAISGWVSALDSVSPKIVDFGTQLVAAISLIGGAIFTARLTGMIGGGGGAVAGAGAGLGAGATAAAGAAGGWFSRMLGGAKQLAGWGAMAEVLTSGGLHAPGAPIVEKPGALAPNGQAGSWVDASGFHFVPTLKERLGDWDEQRRKMQDARDQPSQGRWGELSVLERRLPAADPYAAFAKAPVGPQQKVEVGGSITIKVDGPGKVVGVESVNPAVPIGADRGINGGRP